ncbi:MAG: hypothetical protein WD972_01425 [Candidatus Andersenbacteria bacterium]
MRDPSEFITKKGTPFIVIVSRLAFVTYFIFAGYALLYPFSPSSRLNLVWVVYLLALYFLAERFYDIFRQRNIDMAFAFPILFAIYLLNLVALIFGGQEKFPILNRVEHFAIFVLIAYVISVFFSEYLPHNVWHNHPYYTALLVMSVTALFGVANEIIELLFDTLFRTHHVGRGLDTSLDLLMNTLGSGLMLAVRLIVAPTKPR